MVKARSMPARSLTPSTRRGSHPSARRLWSRFWVAGLTLASLHASAPTACAAWVRKSKAAGARVVLATEISNPSQESESKNALNAIIRAEAFQWGADTLADLATNPTLGADNAYQNTSCFPDGYDPGPNCQPIIAAIESNAVNELIGSSETSRHTTAAASYSETAGDRFLDLSGTSAQTVALPDCNRLQPAPRDSQRDDHAGHHHLERAERDAVHRRGHAEPRQPRPVPAHPRPAEQRRLPLGAPGLNGR